MDDSVAREDAVRIPAGAIELDGDLHLPPHPLGMVVFAHGSGSSRHSPRNRQVAAVLQQAGAATLLMDLLTPEEEQADLRTGHLRGNRFTITLRGVAPDAHERARAILDRLATAWLPNFFGAQRFGRHFRGKL